jgi:DNA-binding response OmpR family regulator
MAESILNHKRLLVVDDEPDVLAIVQDTISQSCPNTLIDKAANYENAFAMLNSSNYDLVILDIMGVRGFDLLEIAVAKNFKTTMLTAHALSPDTLIKAHDMGAMAYLPKDKLGELVPFLEDILRNDQKSGWKRLMERLEDYYREKWGTDWLDRRSWE